MPKRTKDWNEDLSKRLQYPKYAKAFVLACIEDGMSLQDTLSKFESSYGIVEYAKIIDMPRPNLMRATRKNSNPTLTTIRKILAPLNLDITLAKKKAS